MMFKEELSDRLYELRSEENEEARYLGRVFQKEKRVNNITLSLKAKTTKRPVCLENSVMEKKILIGDEVRER